MQFVGMSIDGLIWRFGVLMVAGRSPLGRQLMVMATSGQWCTRILLGIPKRSNEGAWHCVLLLFDFGRV